jgi:hypothetical protein
MCYHAENLTSEARIRGKEIILMCDRFIFQPHSTNFVCMGAQAWIKLVFAFFAVLWKV